VSIAPHKQAEIDQMKAKADDELTAQVRALITTRKRFGRDEALFAAARVLNEPPHNRPGQLLSLLLVALDRLADQEAES